MTEESAHAAAGEIRPAAAFSTSHFKSEVGASSKLGQSSEAQGFAAPNATVRGRVEPLSSLLSSPAPSPADPEKPCCHTKAATTAAQRSLPKPQRRPRRAPASQYISLKQARCWAERVRAAERSARPLNVYVVITWKYVPVDRSPREAFGRLLERLRKWQMARYGEAAYAYVWENPGGLLHTNLLVHCPQAGRSSLRKMLTGWLSAAGRLETAALSFEPIYYLEGLIAYLMKGGDRAVQAEFDVPLDHCRPQGRVVGKRLGVSQRLGTGRELHGEANRLRSPTRNEAQPAGRRPSACALRLLVTTSRLALACDSLAKKAQCGDSFQRGPPGGLIWPHHSSRCCIF